MRLENGKTVMPPVCDESMFAFIQEKREVLSVGQIVRSGVDLLIRSPEYTPYEPEKVMEYRIPSFMLDVDRLKFMDAYKDFHAVTFSQGIRDAVYALMRQEESVV